MSSLGLPVIAPLSSLLARRPPLAPFSTAGFQESKPAPVKSRQEVVHVSSDSGPPTPGNRIKRDSSGFSVVDEPYPSKRQKTEKENVLGNSVKINSSSAASHLPREAERHSDLASVSITNISTATISTATMYC